MTDESRILRTSLMNSSAIAAGDSDQAVSSITNCYFEHRDKSDNPLFDFHEDGRAAIRMNGYAIVPRERIDPNYKHRA